MSHGDAAVATILLESIPAAAANLGIISAVPFALQTRVAFHGGGGMGAGEGSARYGMSFSRGRAQPVSEASEVRGHVCIVACLHGGLEIAVIEIARCAFLAFYATCL